MSELNTKTQTDLLTAGMIAEQLGVPLHVLRYAIERAKIRPQTRIGIVRIWGVEQLPAIRAALAKTQERRGL